MKTLRPINIKQGKTTNMNGSMKIEGHSRFPNQWESQ